MWLKIDDDLINHPKLYAAGRHLGKLGRLRAFGVYMAGLSWVNRHLTDGEIPGETVLSFTIDPKPIQVANVLSFSDVNLWHKTEIGFRIHDYHDHNPNADSVKEKLKRDRDRKRNGADSARNPHGIRSDSCALARARIPARSPVQKDHRLRRAAETVENPKVLKALVWREVAAAWADPAEEFSITSLGERCKVVAAKAGLVYTGDLFHRQLETAMARVSKHHGWRVA